MLAQPDGRMDREVEQQCLVRDANEAREVANVALPAGSARSSLSCECGDPSCTASVLPSHAEYESVRSSGSHFIVAVDHENPENAFLVSEGDRYAVVDVVAGGARYTVRARNPRHAWVDGHAVDRAAHTAAARRT